MSKIAKAVKKVWRPIEKLHSKIANVATLGLWKKTKKIRHKIVKSKAFRMIVAAAAIYFGGAALLSMMGGGTAAAGVGSAWGGLSAGGQALMAGNFSGALSAVSTGFTGAYSTGTATAALTAAGEVGTSMGAQFAAGAQYGGGLATHSAAVAAGGTAAGQAVQREAQNQLAQEATKKVATDAAVNGTTNVATNTGSKLTLDQAANAGVDFAKNKAVEASAANANSGLLTKAWNGLGDAGKSAVISSGINMAGQMMQGKAEQESAEEARKRMTWWGMDGEGNMTDLPSYGNLPAGLMTYSPGMATPGQQFAPTSNYATTLDELIARQKSVLGS